MKPRSLLSVSLLTFLCSKDPHKLKANQYKVSRKKRQNSSSIALKKQRLSLDFLLLMFKLLLQGQAQQTRQLRSLLTKDTTSLLELRIEKVLKRRSTVTVSLSQSLKK